MTSDREIDAARTKVFRAITLLELPKTWGVVAIPSGDFSGSTTLRICILSCTSVYSCKSVDYAKHYPFFLSSVLSSVYLLIVGVEVIVALDRTQTHEVGRTPLDEGSALRRDLYLTTHNTPKRQTSMSSAWFEPTMTTTERPQTHALDHAVTRIGLILSFRPVCNTRCFECLYLFICMGKFIFVLLVAALGSNMESVHSDIVCELASWFYSQSLQILF
jgi:hypothetical protein